MAKSAVAFAAALATRCAFFALALIRRASSFLVYSTRSAGVCSFFATLFLVLRLVAVAAGDNNLLGRRGGVGGTRWVRSMVSAGVLHRWLGLGTDKLRLLVAGEEET
jgi:hypothetical protein